MITLYTLGFIDHQTYAQFEVTVSNSSGTCCSYSVQAFSLQGDEVEFEECSVH